METKCWVQKYWGSSPWVIEVSKIEFFWFFSYFLYRKTFEKRWRPNFDFNVLIFELVLLYYVHTFRSLYVKTMLCPPISMSGMQNYAMSKIFSNFFQKKFFFKIVQDSVTNKIVKGHKQFWATETNISMFENFKRDYLNSSILDIA